jgi:alanyl aminopeptidase
MVLDAPQRSVAVDRCPSWLFPNAAGAGYYRTEWGAAQLGALALDRLSASERLTLAYDLVAMKKAGRLDPAGEAVLTKLAADAEPAIGSAARETR